MVMERDLIEVVNTQYQYADDVLQNCMPETNKVLLTNVIAKNLKKMKYKKK